MSIGESRTNHALSEEIADQVAEFLAKGNKIQEIPQGVVAFTTNLKETFWKGEKNDPSIDPADPLDDNEDEGDAAVFVA